MPYTPPPPLGNAVNFTATGIAYSAPDGSAVNFVPTNAAKFQVPLSVTLQGAVGFSGSGSLSPFVVAALANQQTTAYFHNRSPFVFEAVGDVPLCGAVAISAIAVQASGMAAQIGPASLVVEVGALGIGSAAVTTGEIWFDASVGIASSGVFTDPFIGSTRVAVPISVAVSGFAAIVGNASAPVRFVASAQGNAGVSGVVRVSPFKISSTANHGRTGSAHIPVVPRLTAFGATGVRGLASFGAIGMSSTGAVSETYRGTVSLTPFRVDAQGYHPIPRRRRSVYVLTENRTTYVR